MIIPYGNLIQNQNRDRKKVLGALNEIHSFKFDNKFTLNSKIDITQYIIDF